jgi:hypothetical protein
MLVSLNKIIHHSKFIYLFPLFVILFIFLTNSPSLNYIFSNELNRYGWDTLLYKSKHLFSNLNHVGPESHNAKTVFRLTVPLIVKAFNLSYSSLVLLQFILYYFFIIYLFKYLKRQFDSTVLSFLLVIGISTTYFGKALITDFRWFDGWAYLFFLISIYTRNYFVLFFSIFFGLFTDERFVFSLLVLFLMHNENFDYVKFKFSKFYSKKSMFVLLALFIYLFSRISLHLFLGMEMPTEAIGSAFTDNVQNRLLGLGIFTFFEGYWLIVIYFIWYYMFSKANLLSVFFILLLMLGIISVFLVYDITRSGAYLMPFIFLFLKCLQLKMNDQIYKQLVLMSTIVSVLYPATFVLNGIGMNNFILNDYLYVVVNRLGDYFSH